MKELLTTFSIARLCKVDITTVINWVNTGKLAAYKTPGGHRRIRRQDFLKFLHAYDLPIPRGLESDCTILVAADKKDPLRKLIRSIVQESSPDSEICEVDDGFSAGKLLAEKHPLLVILSPGLTGVDGTTVCQLIRSDRRLKRTKILMITSPKDSAGKGNAPASGADNYLAKPFTRKALSHAIETLLLK